MKQFITYIAFCSLFVFISMQWGCRKADSFLDQKVQASLDEENVFSDSARTLGFLGRIYGTMFYWNNSATPNGVNGPWNEVTDIASTRWPGGANIPNQVFTGTFGDPFYKKISANWSKFYFEIRACNIFLKNVSGKKSPFSPELTKRTRNEARFFRAYMYFYLMKGWGGVPLVGDTVFSNSAMGDAHRNTYAECVDYVVSELDAIADELPLRYSGRDYGRITKGACLALKAKMLQFAASPLFNGGSIAEDPDLIEVTAYPDYDASRWQKALDAFQAVVDLGVYHMYVDNTTEPGYGFYNTFLTRVNPENILIYLQNPNKSVETYVLPKSLGGEYRRYPTQELVDYFPMKNGLPIEDGASGYDSDHPYDNRDPRFYYTVIYNGAEYYNTQKHQMEPIWTYDGADPDGLKPVSANTGTNTGYYTRKMCDVLVNNRSNSALADRSIPIIRYSEILLDLAECANEMGNTALAMQQLDSVRMRAGIDPGADKHYGLPANPTIDEARKLIRNERAIELAFEGKRFWDLRRWKAGDLLNGKYMHGMKITKVGADQFTYTRIETRTRYFEPNLYLFPLPKEEVENDPNLLQNPGW